VHGSVADCIWGEFCVLHHVVPCRDSSSPGKAIQVAYLAAQYVLGKANVVVATARLQGWPTHGCGDQLLIQGGVLGDTISQQDKWPCAMFVCWSLCIYRRQDIVCTDVAKPNPIVVTIFMHRGTFSLRMNAMNRPLFCKPKQVYNNVVA